MTVSYIGNGIILCLSSDTKPTTYPTNTIAIETNTGNVYSWNGSSWTTTSASGMLMKPQSKKYGLHYGTSTAIGLFTNLTAATGGGTNSNQFDNTYGAGLRYVSGATSGNNGGWYVNRTITNRQLNPVLTCLFKLAQVGTDFRSYIGFASQTTSVTTDDPLNGANGYMFGIITTIASKWVILKHSGTAGAGTYTDAGLANIDTNFHTLQLTADNANSRFGWSFDGSATTWDTTDIPAATTALTVHFESETNTTAGRNQDLFYMILET